MGNVVVTNHITLDGVMQAPAAPDEDTSGGFEHGGWAAPNVDAVMGEKLGVGMSSGGALLFGRRTYEHFFAVWPKRTDGNPFTPVLNASTKYVASRTLSEPLPWENSVLLKGDVADAVAGVKQQVDGDLVILGSGVLIQTLMRHDLIDRYVLMIHPVLLGTGRRLFSDGGALASLRLVESLPTTTGVIIATYEPSR